MKATHHKHVKLARPSSEDWGRQEICFLGTDCAAIQQLACQIAQKLSPKYRLSFRDASHQEEEPPPPLLNGFTHYHLEKKHFEQHHILSASNNLNNLKNSNYHRSKVLFGDIDLALVNGNHFEAQHQIVLVNPEKASSLGKRQKQLTHVIALIADDFETIPSFVTEYLPKQATLPRFKLTDIDLISRFIENFILQYLPPLQGLILGGGQSRRMGKDKIFLDYHGSQQHLYLTEILQDFCQEVYVSCQTSQQIKFENPLVDTFLELGPLGGILSAFRHDPSAAWLTVACDHPLLNREGIQKLIAQRDPSKMGTCFFNSETKFPEPLITIWEPKAYALLLHHLANGHACPRQALINGDVNVIHLEDETILQNANTREEYQAMLQKIAKSKELALP